MRNVLGVIIVIFFAFILGLLKDSNIHLGFIPTAIIFYLFLFTLDKFAGWNLGFRKKDKNNIVDNRVNNIKPDKKDSERFIANFVKMKSRELKIQERFKSIFFWSFAPIAFFIFKENSWYFDLNSYANDDEKAFLSVLVISIIFSFFVGEYVDKFILPPISRVEKFGSLDRNFNA